METKKIVLIILTIIILGPIVFVGSCFPIGLFTINYNTPSSFGIVLAFGVGILLAVFVVALVIRKILKSKPSKDAGIN